MASSTRNSTPSGTPSRAPMSLEQLLKGKSFAFESESPSTPSTTAVGIKQKSDEKADHPSTAQDKESSKTRVGLTTGNTASAHSGSETAEKSSGGVPIEAKAPSVSSEGSSDGVSSVVTVNRISDDTDTLSNRADAGADEDPVPTVALNDLQIVTDNDLSRNASGFGIEGSDAAGWANQAVIQASNNENARPVVSSALAATMNALVEARAQALANATT